MIDVLRLGISDPLHRVLAWLAGCGVVSAVGALVGLVAMIVFLAAGVGYVAATARCRPR